MSLSSSSNLGRSSSQLSAVSFPRKPKISTIRNKSKRAAIDKSGSPLIRLGALDVPIEYKSEPEPASGMTKTKHTQTQTALRIMNAAFLVAGTTIGGGFLALPTVVAPSGFYPSAVTLLGVWGYFLAQSFILVECIQRARARTTTAGTGTGDGDPGVAATAQSVFGMKGEVAIGILLTVLIQATLVSQISRAGMLFSSSYYRVGCIVSSFSVAAIVFGPKSGINFAAKANSVLTTLFILSCVSVFGCGVGIADWTRLGVSNNWSSIPSAVPTFLQLLVYGEIVPTVCQILKYNTKHIHTAIILGSCMTLCLQIGWSALGMALVSTVTSAASTSNLDPVNVLLASSGPVRVPLFCLAITAILTTILGSYLALLSAVNDFVQQRKEGGFGLESLGQRIKVASLITVPASLIACTSPSVFLKAIDFAGSYPVLLLWGVVPPVMALIQRFRERRDSVEGVEGDGDEAISNTSGPSAWLALLASISLGMVVLNAGQDISSLFRRFISH